MTRCIHCKCQRFSAHSLKRRNVHAHRHRLRTRAATDEQGTSSASPSSTDGTPADARSGNGAQGAADDPNCETVCSVEGDFQPPQSKESQQLDLYKAGGTVAALTIVAAALNTSWVASHQQMALIAIFVLGYAGIIVEEELAFNKAGVALVMAVALWTVRSLSGDHAVRGAFTLAMLPGVGLLSDLQTVSMLHMPALARLCAHAQQALAALGCSIVHNYACLSQHAPARRLRVHGQRASRALKSVRGIHAL